MNLAIRRLKFSLAVSAAILLVAAVPARAGVFCPNDPASLSQLPAGTPFILKKKIIVQEISHESEHFGRATACSFWVGKPQTLDFEDEIADGITFKPQTFVLNTALNSAQQGPGKFWLKTAQGKIVTLYCDDSARITSLASLQAALSDTFTISIPYAPQKACAPSAFRN